jgi:branched-chain amino acid transport system substrate-binding protein
MTLARRAFLGTAAASTLPFPRARAQAPVIKIGVLTDMSGPYATQAGPTSVACARQAVQDFGEPGGFKVEVIVADHKNSPDIGSGMARQWIDQDGVDFIVDLPNSGVALAVSSVVRERNKVCSTNATTTELTSAQCSPNLLQWTVDTYILAKSTGGAVIKGGGTSWYFIVADYTFGHILERDTSRLITAANGKVLGSVTYPFPGTTDFSSYLIRAQASGAKVLALATSGADTVNCLKQAHEFGIVQQGMRIAGLLVYIDDIDAIGLETAQGLLLTETFYWDLNDRTRSFTARVKPKIGDSCPNMSHAGTYSGTLHYLKAVASLGAAEAKANGAGVVERMKAMPVEDDCFGRCSVRADGLTLHPAYLFQVKSPAESRGRWDYYKLAATTPGDEVSPPLAEEKCPLIHI